jgi:gentisate 1,2-dioxygenase
MEAVQKTPEREAFYKKIDGENLSALWNVMGDLITPQPKSACRCWKIPDCVASQKSPRHCSPACKW